MTLRLLLKQTLTTKAYLVQLNIVQGFKAKKSLKMRAAEIMQTRDPAVVLNQANQRQEFKIYHLKTQSSKRKAKTKVIFQIC